MDSSKVFIPKEFQSELENLLSRLEETTGKQYEFEIRQYGVRAPMCGEKRPTIGDFSNRDKYIVYDMTEKYKELEGTYTSPTEIKERVKFFVYKNVLTTEFPEAWKCPKCNHSKRNDTMNDICQNHECPYRHRNKWNENHIGIGLKRGNIYTHS